jgi:hypothetical protein
VIITTSMLGSTSFTRRSSSMPSICGILMSMKMRSGWKAPIEASAASPLSAVAMSWWGLRIIRSDSRGPISSSTTRMRARSMTACSVTPLPSAAAR